MMQINWQAAVRAALLGMVLALLGCGPGSPPADGGADGSAPPILILSNRADMISGGDVLVEIGVDADTQGVVILGVSRTSDAAAEGLQRGMVIRSVNRQPVADAESFEARVAAARRAGDDQVLLLIQTRSGQRYISVDFAEQ